MDPIKELTDRAKQYRYREEALRDFRRTFEQLEMDEDADAKFSEWEKSSGKVWEQMRPEQPEKPKTFTERFGNPKALVDFAAGAPGGAMTGTMGGPVGMIGGGIAGGIANMFANEGEPVTSAGNIAGLASAPLGMVSKAAMGTKLASNPLRQGLVNVAENLATTAAGREGAAAAGTPSSLSPEMEYGIGAGVPLAVGVGVGGAVRAAQRAPGIWQQLIAKLSPNASAEETEKTMSILKTMGDGSAPTSAKLNELNKFQTAQDKVLKQAEVSGKTLKQVRSEAVQARAKLQDILRRKADVGFEIDDELVQSRAAQAEARKSIQDIDAKIAEGRAAINAMKAKIRLDNYNGFANRDDVIEMMAQEEEYFKQIADLYMEKGSLQNIIEDQTKYQTQRANVASFNTKNKSAAEIAAREAKAEAVKEVNAAKRRHAQLLTKIESGDYDIKQAEKELTDLIRQHRFDPRSMQPESLALLDRMAKDSPETVIRQIMDKADSNSKAAIKNLMQITARDPKVQNNIRASLARELVKPTEVFTHGTRGQIGASGEIPAKFMERIQSLGKNSINDIYNSPNAYDNLVAYGKMLEKAQQTYPVDFRDGSFWKFASLAGGGSYFVLPMFFGKAASGLGAAAVMGASVPMYLNIQGPHFVNKLIRANPTMSKLFQAMAANPEKFMSGSNASRLLNAYLRGASDELTFDNNGKPMTIKLNRVQDESEEGKTPLNPGEQRVGGTDMIITK